MMYPGMKEPHSYYPNDDEFVAKYLDLVTTLYENVKLNAAEKIAKINALEQANKVVLDKIAQEHEALFEVWVNGIRDAKNGLDEEIKKG